MNKKTEQIFLINPPIGQSSVTTQLTLKTPVPSQINLENVEDLSTVCRTCATTTEFLVPIFSGTGLQNNLADKIRKHLPIQVQEQDELPGSVCFQCANKLLAWHEMVACCQQADAALKTRLQQIRSKTQRIVNVEDVLRNGQELVTVSKLGGRVKEKKETKPSAVVASLRNCQYCRAPVPPKAYKDHIITYHAGLVFHCDECNSYVDKRIFIYHMSAHSLEYTREAKIKQQRDRDENQNAKAEPQPVSEVKIKQLPAVDAEPTENTTSLETPVASANDAQNEFSDHSDAEYGFGPLPESVFEAIEDSQEVNALNKSPSTRPDNPLTEITESNNKTEPKDSNKKKSRTCPQCGKVYTVSSSYFYHVKHYHHALKTHGCTVCGRKFATQSMVNAHMQTHSGKFDYECKHCKKRFRSKPSLYIHEQSHIGVKKHSCTLCDISFRWRTHLERHMKRHSAERKHICSKCKRGFDVHCDLLRHMRTHVTGKFICDICDTTFKQKRYLKVHMTKHVEK